MMNVFKQALGLFYFLYFALIVAIFILIAFPFTFLLFLFPSKVGDSFMFYVVKLGCYFLTWAGGMIPQNIHRKKVDFSKPYITIPTHSSYLDAANIYTALPKLFKALGKKELEKTPLYGRIFKAVCISVDRSSLLARATSFRKMKQELERGLSIVIFPEGTFQDEPTKELLPFQDGSFTLALLQKTDLLPLLFIDSSKRMHPSKITKLSMGKNRAIFLPPIPIQNIEKKDVEKLKNFTQNYMQSCLHFIDENNTDDVWNFAQQFQKNNSIL